MLSTGLTTSNSDIITNHYMGVQVFQLVICNQELPCLVSLGCHMTISRRLESSEIRFPKHYKGKGALMNFNLLIL